MADVSAAEWVGIVASVATLVSLTFNIYQWRRRQDMIQMHYTTITCQVRGNNGWVRPSEVSNRIPQIFPIFAETQQLTG